MDNRNLLPQSAAMGPEPAPGPSPLPCARYDFLMAGQVYVIPGPLLVHGFIFSNAFLGLRMVTLLHGQDTNAPIFCLVPLATQTAVPASFDPPVLLQQGLCVYFSGVTCYLTLSYTPLARS